MKASIAVCPGTFDPVTNGHMDIIDRAAKLFDTVVIGVAKSPAKCPLFSLEERLRFVEDAIGERSGVRVEAFDELLVDFAKRHDSRSVIKGLRATSDFEREFQMAQFTRRLDPEVETLFMMATPEYMFLSSSAVKEIASYGGSVRGLVPEAVETALFSKYQSGLEGGSQWT
ncbi:MAG: pantetheine-phosphate adenylyltransferase [Actinobacteria bacterium]|nr:MAG: pantetheine-phosphate adenylyltransferase [Actinomycetota bacterium]